MFRLLIIEAEGLHLTCIMGPRQKNRVRQYHTVLGLWKLSQYFTLEWDNLDKIKLRKIVIPWKKDFLGKNGVSFKLELIPPFGSKSGFYCSTYLMKRSSAIWKAACVLMESMYELKGSHIFFVKRSSHFSCICKKSSLKIQPLLLQKKILSLLYIPIVLIRLLGQSINHT